MSKPTNSINKIKDTQNVVHEIVPHSLTDGNYQVGLPELKSDIVVPYSTLQGVSNCYDTSTTDTAGTWTTSIPNITELTEGLTIKIRLKTSYNGTINTLNVNGLGAKTIYFRYGNKLTSHYGKESVLALTYTSNAISSGTDRSGWIVENIYDSTNTFQLRKYYSRYTTKSVLYRYMICFVNKDNLLVPANNVNNSTATTKTLTTDSFDLSKGIYYYNSTTTVAAGGLTGTAILYQQIGLLDLRYSFNTGTTLVAHKPVYLVVSRSGTYGEVVLATNPIAQEMPTTNDENYYVFLGYAYDTYRIELTLDHPIYVYNAKRAAYVAKDFSQDTNISKNATDILDINTSISNLENNKVSKSGDTMTGSLTISSGSSINVSQYNDAGGVSLMNNGGGSATQFGSSGRPARMFSSVQPEWWQSGASKGVLALKSDIPSSLKNPNALSFGNDSYDGSIAKTIRGDNTYITSTSSTTIKDYVDNTAQDIREVAEGKTQTYVLSHSFSIPTDTGLSVGNYYDADGNKINNSQDILNYLGSGWSVKDLVNINFNSQNNSIGLVSANSIGTRGFLCVEVGDKKIFAKVVENQTIYSFFKTGDVILVTETDVPDRWIDGSNAYKLETTKVDLTPYAKTSDIPTVNNATLTIQKNGTNVATFTANSSSNATANITVPTKVSELTNDSGYLTSHQDISGKVNKSGDTMTGSLTISSGSITAPQYNDAHSWPVIRVIDDSVTEISNSYTSTRIYSDTQPEWWLLGSSQGVLALKSDIPTYTFNGAVSTIKDSNLTASRALISNSSGKVAVSDVTSTELGYLDGVTSNVQTQLNAKASASDAITSVTWTDTAGELNFKNSAGTTKSTITLPISHYFGTTYGECWTINAPNLEYSIQIGESGFTVDELIPGEENVYNVLQATSDTFTYNGYKVLTAGNAIKMASFYQHSSGSYVDIRTNQGSSTTNGITIIVRGQVTLAGVTNLSLAHSMPNTNYALFFTEVNSSANTAYTPIIRSKSTTGFSVYIGSGGIVYDYVAIYVG